MASVKGKNKSKAPPKPKDSSLLDPVQQRRERISLAIMLLGVPTIVLGMIVLSAFLSGGTDKAMKNEWLVYTFAGLAVLMAAGIGYQYATKKRPAA